MLAIAIHGRPRGFIEWNPQAKTRAALMAWLKEKPAPHDMT